MEYQILSNGIKIPVLGLGIWFIDDDKAEQAVISATKIGYRHIDTAQTYGNERGVGAGVKNCGIHEYYEPEELVGKTCIAITNLPPRAMMGIDSCGMLISAVHTEEGKEKLHLSNH